MGKSCTAFVYEYNLFSHKLSVTCFKTLVFLSRLMLLL